MFRSRYFPLTKEITNQLEAIVGPRNVLTDHTDLVCYARDHSPVKHVEQFEHVPDVVVLPEATEHVVDIIRLANRERIPITPRGAGTGFTGNAVPRFGGILLDMKKMHKVAEIDENNMIVTAQTGISLMMLDRELAERGLMLGHDPASYPSATLGGAISTNGVGWRALKYGSMIDQILGLKIVLPSGELVKTGGTSKSSVGYNLKQLFCGAFGTLGVITEATLKAFPRPEKVFCRAFAFDDLNKANETALKLLKRGITFSVLNITDSTGLLAWKKIMPSITISEARLILVLEGPKEEVEALKRVVMKLCREATGRDLGVEEGKNIWDGRHRAPAQTGLGHALCLAEEPGVKLSDCAEMIERIKSILEKHGLRGHVLAATSWVINAQGTCTFVNWALDENDEENWISHMKVSEEIAEAALELEGTTSSVHGLGYRRLDKYVSLELGSAFEIMKRIKRALDPSNIMNPGKLGLDAAYSEV